MMFTSAMAFNYSEGYFHRKVAVLGGVPMGERGIFPRGGISANMAFMHFNTISIGQRVFVNLYLAF